MRGAGCAVADERRTKIMDPTREHDFFLLTLKFCAKSEQARPTPHAAI